MLFKFWQLIIYWILKKRVIILLNLIDKIKIKQVHVKKTIKNVQFYNSICKNFIQGIYIIYDITITFYVIELLYNTKFFEIFYVS